MNDTAPSRSRNNTDKEASPAKRSPRAPEAFQPRPLTMRTRLLAWLISTLARLIFATLRLRIVNDGAIERLLAENRGLIIVTWHGRVLLPLRYFRDRGYWTIISVSRDGDLQAENFRRSGFRIVRGSTSKRSVLAIREVLAALREGGVLAFVPDGPRGPSGKVQPGVVYFAQRLGFPILPIANSAWPRWLAPSWDRFLVPWPFARAVWVNGDPITVGPDDDLDEAALRVERAILAAEAEAERLVVPPEVSRNDTDQQEKTERNQ